MRLVTFETSGKFGRIRRLGALEPGTYDDPETMVIDLQIAYLASLSDQKVDAREATRLVEASVPSSMERFVAGGGASLAAARQALRFARGSPAEALVGPGGRRGLFERSEVRLLAPLAQPNSLRDFLAFEDHARAGAERRDEPLAQIWYERPLYYKGNHRSILGPDEPLPRPTFTRELDFELEVACVVGTTARDLDERAATDAIFGFTILNDWSARDVQRAEMAARLGPAKSKDFATSIGPCILTADEAGPHPALEMIARRNGVELCRANLADCYWTFPKMMEFVSAGEAVWPTDLYGSGTPLGGCLLDHGGHYLEPGDVVELEVERIGILRNEIT